MRQRFVLLCALVVLAAGVECPIQPPGNSGYRFTSADLRQSNNAWWTWGGLPAAGRDEDIQAGGEMSRGGPSRTSGAKATSCTS